MDRGRRDPVRLRAGDAVNFFRVVEAEEPHHLHFLSEMKLPGEASLEFILHAMAETRTGLQQLARYVPKGLSGSSTGMSSVSKSKLIWNFTFPELPQTSRGNSALLKGDGQFIIKRKHAPGLEVARYLVPFVERKKDGTTDGSILDGSD